MFYRMIILAVTVFCTASMAYKSYLFPAVTTVNTGVERIWVWSGISGGFLLGERHRLGGEAYYWNRDEVIGGVTLQNRLHLHGTIYGSWEYQVTPLPFLLISGGVSVGFQYTEVDRNWDSTFVGEYRTENGDVNGTVPLNWEAESKFTNFGGPQISLGFGWKQLFLTSRFRLNCGLYKKWGGYTSNDLTVTDINCNSGLKVSEVTVSKPGWQKSKGGVEEKGFKVLPEWQLGFVVLF